jgi:hypothetical protein
MSTRQATLENWRVPTRRISTTSLNIPTQDPITQSENYYLGVPRMIQQSIRKEQDSNKDTYWGHQIHKKLDSMCRIGVRNINSLPIKSNHSKNAFILKDIEEGEFDVFCTTEVNIAWHNVEAVDKVNERFRGKLEFAKYTTSHNEDRQYKEKYQRGGTMIVANGNICARIVETGQEKGLGRWSWIKIRGCRGLTVIIATIYRPVYAEGALSTYQQHKSMLLLQGINKCPRY